MPESDENPDLICDVAVIGAGTAGLTAERVARQAGAKTLLIDPEFAGTTCATVGCMPSKLLIAAADAAHHVAEAGVFGIDARRHVDGARVMQRLHRERDRFVQGVKDGFAKIPGGVCIRARASFAGPTRLRLDDCRSVSAGAIVIATGSAASVPGFLDPVAAHVLTNETVFDLTTLPASLGVVGAGPLGLEMAQAFHRLGVDVEVFDKGDTIAGLSDAKVSEALVQTLRKGFPVHLGVELTASEADGKAQLKWTGAERGGRTFSHILAAAGRPPNLKELNLEAAGLALDDRGVPEFDPETLRCGESAVFIAGDANADRPLLHEAHAEGTVAGRNAAAFPNVEPVARKVPLAIAFTRPEAATVGTPPGPDEGGYVVGEASYENQGRATVEARGAGLVRLFARAGDGRLTAAALCAPDAEHLAHLLAWAIQSGKTASELLDHPFYHPTLEEGLRPALREICTRAGTPTSRGEDDHPAPGELAS